MIIRLMHHNLFEVVNKCACTQAFNQYQLIKIWHLPELTLLQFEV